MPTSENLESLSALTVERDRLRREREYLVRERDLIRAERDRLAAFQFVPPGHFYSPIPDPAEVRRDDARIFSPTEPELPGVDLAEPLQLKLLGELAAFYPDLPFTAAPSPDCRYYYENPAYGYADGIFLYSMLRYWRPARVIEIGSGYSSCVMLDVNDRWFDRRLKLTFIDPYTQVLEANLRAGDRERVTILPQRVQDVPSEVFAALGANDILFVDSTHVSKIGSDVNEILFRILPALKPGVVVHFHDVFFPFEYPREWVYDGRAWNEDYLLRAFLQYNSAFRVLLFSTFLARFHADRLAALMPLTLKNPGGDIWLQRV